MIFRNGLGDGVVDEATKDYGTTSIGSLDLSSGLANKAAKAVVSGVVSKVLVGVPVLPSLVTNLGVEALQTTPEYGVSSVKTGIASLAGYLANMAIPGLGLVVGPLAGYMTKHSLQDGWMGDAIDTRSDERKRDSIEAFGFDRSDTKDMAKQSDFESRVGEFDNTDGYSLSPSLDDVDPMGRFTKDVFGPTKLSDYDGFGFGDDGPNDSSESGSGIGGVSGADMGKGSESW